MKRVPIAGIRIPSASMQIAPPRPMLINHPCSWLKRYPRNACIGVKLQGFEDSGADELHVEQLMPHAIGPIARMGPVADQFGDVMPFINIVADVWLSDELVKMT